MDTEKAITTLLEVTQTIRWELARLQRENKELRTRSNAMDLAFDFEHRYAERMRAECSKRDAAIAILKASALGYDQARATEVLYQHSVECRDNESGGVDCVCGSSK